MLWPKFGICICSVWAMAAAAKPWPRSGGTRPAPQRRLGPGLGPGRALLRRSYGLRGLRFSSSGSRGGHSLWAS